MKKFNPMLLPALYISLMLLHASDALACVRVEDSVNPALEDICGADEIGAEVGALMFMALLLLVIVVWIDFKKKAKAKVLKMFFNLLALFCLPVAPWMTTAYSVIRIIIRLIFKLFGR